MRKFDARRLVKLLRTPARRHCFAAGVDAMNEAMPFACPTCGAYYKLERVEAPPTLHEGQLVCTSCGGPLRVRGGRFALKYFRVGGSQRYPLRPRKWRQDNCHLAYCPNQACEAKARRIVSCHRQRVSARQVPGQGEGDVARRPPDVPYVTR
jgi:predicted RNA-binding Zn-ribbon protein involved in translation (DUF1610 family)